MNLLVTGGAGFIGGNFIYFMQKRHPECRLVCLDALTYAGSLLTLREAMETPNFRFVRGDIGDRKAVWELFEEEGFDAVVNFAAESHVDRSIETPELFLRTNLLGTQVLLDACRKYGVPRFHQISTDEVYGDLPLDRRETAFTEVSPLRPSSPYSASKAAADLLVLSYFRTYGLPATISRCSNNYGPFQFPEKLIPMTMARAEQGKSIPVYGTGKNVRDWIYAEDHCAAVDRILERGRPGEIYNVGGRTERTNLETVAAVLRAMGRENTPVCFVADRPGHDLRYAVNADKLRAELGWEPRTDFEAGIRSTVQWYRTHRFWREEVEKVAYRSSRGEETGAEIEDAP